MTHLVGDTSTATFTGTVGLNSGALQNKIFLSSNTANPYTAAATGTARNLTLYISAWGSVSNVKCCIYDTTGSSALLESVIVNSSVGTGLVSIPLAETTTITSSNKYRLGIYTDSNNSITMHSTQDGAFPYLYNTTSSGNYSTPIDPAVSGGWVSDDIFFWALDDLAAGPSISSTDPAVDQVQSSITTTGLTTATSASLGGDTITLGGTIPNLTYTYDTAGISSAQSVPRIGETVTLSVTGAEGTATESVVTAVKSGWAFVTLTSTDKTAGGLLAHLDSDLSKTTAIGDQIYYDSADSTTVTAAGVLTSDATSFEMVLIQGGTATVAGTGTPATVNTAAVGGGSGSAIKSINISSIKIGL